MSDKPTLPPSTRVIYALFDLFPKTRRWIFTGVVVVVFAVVLAKGLYIVKKEEQGVLTRFGKVVEAEVGPGVHYRIPIIEKAHIRQVLRIIRHQISSNEGGKIDFTILSGDTNLFEVDVAIQYKIDHLKNYLFASSDPIAVVTMLVRQEMVNSFGQNFIDMIFTTNRNIIQDRLFEQVTESLETIDIGIEVVSLDIIDLRPIEETIDAFRDVSDAVAERVQVESNANRRMERLLAHSRGQADALVTDAKAKANERTVQAQSSADAFSALLAEYRKTPEHVSITRYWERMRKIFTEASLSAVNPDEASTIDINMIDGIAGFAPPGPATLLTDAPRTVDPETPERPLLATVMRENEHSIETGIGDNLLLDGQFHNRRSERDHMSSATPRSLIFDTPSIFSHRHVAPTALVVEQQATEKPMVEVLTEEKEKGESGDQNP
ncbi:MAG: hypothetical protein F7B06_02305 [Opitutae bacterium]|nr:hypothetical protein [Opitutae bacterium]MBC9888688.1 hypothetical protein [Opitutae bacterium]